MIEKFLKSTERVHEAWYAIMGANFYLYDMGFHKERLILLRGLERYLEGKDYPYEKSILYSNLGDILFPLGRTEEALNCYRKYNEITQEIVKENPTEENRRDLAISFSKVGFLFIRIGRTQEGLKNLFEARKIHKEIYENDPINSLKAFELASVSFIIFLVTQDKKYFQEARDLVCKFKQMRRVHPHYQDLITEIEKIAPCNFGNNYS